MQLLSLLAFTHGSPFGLEHFHPAWAGRESRLLVQLDPPFLAIFSIHHWFHTQPQGPAVRRALCQAPVRVQW